MGTLDIVPGRWGLPIQIGNEKHQDSHSETHSDGKRRESHLETHSDKNIRKHIRMKTPGNTFDKKRREPRQGT